VDKYESIFATVSLPETLSFTCFSLFSDICTCSKNTCIMSDPELYKKRAFF
jgi:hypothetical protein